MSRVASDPRVYYTGTGLNSGVATYIVSLTCASTADTPATGVSTDVTVHVAENLPPFFNVYPGGQYSSVWVELLVD